MIIVIHCDTVGLYLLSSLYRSDPSLEKIGPKVPLSTGYSIRPPIPSKPAPVQPPPPPLPPSNLQVHYAFVYNVISTCTCI